MGNCSRFFHVRLSVLLLLLLVGNVSFAQDSTTVLLKNEIGFSLNNYLPRLEHENRPYLFALEYRRRIKSNEKFDQFLTVRTSGNYNRLAIIKPYTSKLFLAGELCYFARKSQSDSKWYFTWGVTAGMFNIKETITPKWKSPLLFVDEPSFSRSYFKLAISPGFGVAYAITETLSAQAFFSVGFGTRYFGETTHLKINASRGFSAQFPSLGLYQRF